ncbi:MAG: tetratricopeptide repeat protein [Isosphaeraceae bacterium]
MKKYLIGIGLLVSLVGLTAWNLTRSDALGFARQAYARGELASCLQYALDHLDRRPWSHEAVLLVARCLSRLDYADAAEPYYKRAGRLDLNDLHIRAFGLVRANHRQRAIEAYEQILACWPDNVTALRRLAAVQFTQKNAPQLEALANRLIQTPHGAVIGYTLQGAVAHSDKDYERAVLAFEHVLEHDPELRVMPLPQQIFWSDLAEDLIKLGRHADASRYLTHALNGNPDPVLMDILGRAYLLQGAFDESARCFQQAAQWDPSDYVPLLQLGKVELQRQQPKRAKEYLEAAHKLAPQRLDVLDSLARTHRLLGQPTEAVRVERLMNELRQKARSARDPKKPWPEYAL